MENQPCDKEKVADALSDWLNNPGKSANQIIENHDGVSASCLQKAYEEWLQKGNR